MDLELKKERMDLFMKEIGKTTKKKGKDYTFQLKGICTKVIGRTMSKMDKEFMFFVLAKNILENLKMDIKKGKESL